MRQEIDERIVITGLGTICALGHNKISFWQNLIAGKNGYGEVTIFDVSQFPFKTACEVRGFHPELYLGKTLSDKTSRCTQFALMAAQEAYSDSGLKDQISPDRMGVIVGTNEGGFLDFEEADAQPSSRLKHHHIQLFRISDAIASQLPIKGPVFTISTSCTSGTNSIGIGKQLITEDKADVIIAGASNTLCRLNFSTFCSVRAMEKRICRPFDAKRRGVILGEGASFLILERYKTAVQRRARIYAELASFAISCDAHHLSIPHPQGRGAALAIEKALSMAGIPKTGIDYINAHGTGTLTNDAMETAAIKSIFGEYAYHIPVSSIKSMVGHCMGSGGAIECLATVLAVYNNICPPTINYSIVDPACDLDYVPNVSRRKNIRAALCNSFGGGGINSVCIFRKAE